MTRKGSEVRVLYLPPGCYRGKIKGFRELHEFRACCFLSGFAWSLVRNAPFSEQMQGKSRVNPAIAFVPQPGRKSPWRLRTAEGDRYFRTKRAATDALKVALDARQAGLSADEIAVVHQMRLFGLDPRRASEALATAAGASSFAEMPVSDAISAFMRDCGERRLRAATVEHYQRMLDAFAAAQRPDLRVSEVTAESVVLWILGRYAPESSRATCRTPLQAFLRWCALPPRQWCDPAVGRGIRWRVSRGDEIRPRCLTPAEAEGLMNALPRHHQPAAALALFAGIRPHGELQRLEWTAIDFDTRTIDIAGLVAKTRVFRRLHDLSDNLWAWLGRVPKKQRKGRVVAANYRNWRVAVKKARTAAGIKVWTKDVMRHSFASYGYHRGLEWAVDTMGQVGGFRTFVNHYKGAASRAEADRYFAIAPETRRKQR